MNFLIQTTSKEIKLKLSEVKLHSKTSHYTLTKQTIHNSSQVFEHHSPFEQFEYKIHNKFIKRTPN